MATRKTTPAVQLPQPELSQPREDVRLQIADRITKGQDILNAAITNDPELEEARNKRKIWHEYNEELLGRVFTNEKEAKEYRSNANPSIAFVSMGPTPFYEKVDDFRASMKRRISNLESLQERLVLIPEAKGVAKSEADEAQGISSLLHPIIRKECVGLVESGYFGEAVEKSFKIVRDKLRTLTGHETSSEAFGKGNLFIKGAAASNVEDDFQSAVKFLGMSIDFFRNEKAHTVTANVSSEDKAYQYLVLSSIALQHLDRGEIRKTV